MLYIYTFMNILRNNHFSNEMWNSAILREKRIGL